jgi:replicative DNA helicase
MKYPVNMTATNIEQSFISSVFAEPSVLNHIDVDCKVFYDPRHKSIIESIKSLTAQNEPVDLAFVSMNLSDTKKLAEVGLNYLTETATSFTNGDNAAAYYKHIVEKYELRYTYNMAIKLQRTLESVETAEDRGELVLKAAKALQDSVNVQTNGFKHIKDVMVNTVMKATESREGLTGIPTGFNDLDAITLGWQKNNLVIIGARPSMGKTAFMLNTAEHAGKSGALVPIYSLEMDDAALGDRMVSSNGRIDSKRLKQGSGVLSGDEWARLVQSSGELSEYDIIINDTAGVRISQIEADLRELRKKNPDREILCMIDYLQLILGDERLIGNKTQEVGDISRRLKLLCKELGITIIALSQLSRGVEQRQDKRPMMSDIRESGQIEQDADVIGFLYREDYYDKSTDLRNIIELIIAKNREGQVGTVQLAFVKEYGRMVNLERRFEQ